MKIKDWIFFYIIVVPIGIVLHIVESVSNVLIEWGWLWGTFIGVALAIFMILWIVQ